MPGGDELILRRVNRSDGRKTAWINDRRVSGEVLRRLSETLLELHGQHDDRGLLDPKGHRDVLDLFAGTDKLRGKTRKAWQHVSAARKALNAAQVALDEAKAEEDFLRHAVKELDKLDPQPGEEAELDTRRRMMQNAEKVREDVSRAHAALGNGGAESAMGDAMRWLDGALAETGDVLEAPVAALERALNELADAVDGVERCLEALDFNPHELEELEERLFAIRGLARKYNVLPDELGDFAEELRRRLTALDAGEGDIATLTADLTEAESA